jgi:antirestriction protein ArdC
MAKAEELKAEITRQAENIIKAADAARRSAAFQAWLKCAGSFHRYSAGNVWLILFQRPDATRVAGYKRWQSLGRQVRRGEKGIAIIAPVPILAEVTDVETGETRKVRTDIRFTGATVFDISQTDGEPLPEQPDWRGTGRQPQVESALLHYAHSLGIKAKEYNSARGPAGYYDQHKNEIGYSTSVNVCHAIAHELAHALTQDQRAALGKAVDEPLTDLAAAIVCEHFGIATTAETANYIATWTEEPKQLLALADLAQKTAHKIIEEVEALAAPPAPEPERHQP